MNSTNLNLEMERLMERLPQGTPLLLHACCGPCSTTALQRLCGHFDVTVYFYNPNIDTAAEFEKRQSTLQSLLQHMPLQRQPRLVQGAYEPEVFLRAVRGLEEEPEGGARCEACFRLRLDSAARYAAGHGFGWYGTTLSVSPHKNAALLCALGGVCGEEAGVAYLPSDLKKRDGYRRSVRLSAEYGLYRQHYCGCVFSRRQGQAPG